MTLQTSGAISFSQIVTEFGGVGSHSLSEYYPLLGQGVSGLPSSGQFSFSQFHGKSKNVVTSVWTSSGYNDTVLTSMGNVGGSWASGYASFAFAGNNGWQSGTLIGGNTYAYGNYWVGGYYYVSRSGAYAWSQPLTKYQNVTTWVDTSGYVDTASVATITT